MHYTYSFLKAFSLNPSMSAGLPTYFTLCFTLYSTATHSWWQWAREKICGAFSVIESGLLLLNHTIGYRQTVLLFANSNPTPNTEPVSWSWRLCAMWYKNHYVVLPNYVTSTIIGLPRCLSLMFSSCKEYSWVHWCIWIICCCGLCLLNWELKFGII